MLLGCFLAFACLLDIAFDQVRFTRIQVTFAARARWRPVNGLQSPRRKTLSSANATSMFFAASAFAANPVAATHTSTGASSNLRRLVIGGIPPCGQVQGAATCHDSLGHVEAAPPSGHQSLKTVNRERL